MKRALGSLIVLAISLYGSGAATKVRDGSELLQQCTATIGAHMMFCFGYVDAVVDSLLRNGDVCLSSEVDDPQLRNIVVGFLKNNPTLLRLNAPELIGRALTTAFPCR